MRRVQWRGIHDDDARETAYNEEQIEIEHREEGSKEKTAAPPRRRSRMNDPSCSRLCVGDGHTCDELIEAMEHGAAQ